MLDLTRDKLIILPLHVGSSGKGLQDFQRIFLFTVMMKLTLFSELICKNTFLKEETNPFEARLTAEQKLQGLYQYALNNRSRFVLTGAVIPRMVGLKQTLKNLKLSIKLFDTSENRYLLDVSYEIHKFPEANNTLQTFGIPLEDMNPIANWIATLITGIVRSDEAISLMPYALRHTMGNSLESLYYLIQSESAPDYNGRLRSLEAAVKADPNMEYAYLNLGKNYRLANNYTQSIHNYQKAFEVSQCPDSMKAFYASEIGINYALTNHYDEATQWWLKSIELAPTYLNPYMNMGLAFEEGEKYEEAENNFLKALAIEPNDIRNSINLARIYSKIGQWEKALVQYKFLNEKDDKDPWCHNDMGTCYLQMGDTKNALSHFEKTARLDPEGEAGQYAKLILAQFTAV